jgi:hypothetical protein
MRDEPMTTTVWLDAETFALLKRTIDHLEAIKGQRITSGQAVAHVLRAWLEEPTPLTDAKNR